MRLLRHSYDKLCHMSRPLKRSLLVDTAEGYIVSHYMSPVDTAKGDIMSHWVSMSENVPFYARQTVAGGLLGRPWLPSSAEDALAAEAAPYSYERERPI